MTIRDFEILQSCPIFSSIGKETGNEVQLESINQYINQVDLHCCFNRSPLLETRKTTFFWSLKTQSVKLDTQLLAHQFLPPLGELHRQRKPLVLSVCPLWASVDTHSNFQFNALLITGAIKKTNKKNSSRNAFAYYIIKTRYLKVSHTE